MNRLEELTPGKTEAKFWRQRLMDATDATGDDFKVQRSMMAAVGERQRLDEDAKRRVMSLPIVGPAAAIKDPKWTDDAEALIFADKSALVMGLLDEETGGLHVIAVREWINNVQVLNLGGGKSIVFHSSEGQQLDLSGWKGLLGKQ